MKINIYSLFFFSFLFFAFCNDLAIVSNTIYETILSIVTIILIIHLSLYFYFKKIIKPYFIWKYNKFIIAYFLCLYFLNLIYHPLNITTLLRLLAYTLVSVSVYIIIPYYLFINNVLREKIFKIIVFFTMILSITILWPSVFGNSFFGIPISLKTGYSFLGFYASGGILSHPLTAGTQIVLGIGLCIYLFKVKHNILYMILIVFMLFILMITQARGAVFALSVGVLYVLLPNKISKSNIMMLIFIPISIILLFIFIIPFAKNIDILNRFLRLDGNILSYRGILWAFGLDLIKNRPLVGYGFLQSSNELAHSGLLDAIPTLSAGAPFHSTFIDNAVDSGLLSTFIYSMLFITPIIRARKYWPVKSQAKLIVAICYGILISAIFINYNIGGVRFVSITIAILLGLANWSILTKHKMLHLIDSKP